MPTPTTYEIGLTSSTGGMNLLTIQREPTADFQDFAGRVRLGNGLTQGVGSPVVTWHFGYLDAADYTFFKAFCPNESADVFIATMNNSQSLSRYSCVMEVPEKYERRNGKVIDVTFVFRNLVVLA